MTCYRAVGLVLALALIDNLLKGKGAEEENGDNGPNRER